VIPAKVHAAFAMQADACRGMDSPFMGQLCDLLATRSLPDSALRDRIYGWNGDISPTADSVPLHLCGAFHALVLEGADLGELYPPACVSDDALWDGISAAFVQQSGFIDHWIDSPPQTNEVRRSAALIAIGHWLTDRFDLPLQVTELGASGGLNLMWDRFALDIGGDRYGPTDAALTLSPEWSGDRPPFAPPTVIKRQGIDLKPLNPRDAADALRLRAYLWPDQPDRIARTNAAIAVNEVVVEQGDAIDWLSTHLDQSQGVVHLIYSTVAWQYFPKDIQAKGTCLIEAAGEMTTNRTPLAWFSMETDGGTPGAALTLRLWPHNLEFTMGRMDFHGRWVSFEYAA
jgi:hypothetical protein